MVRNGVTYAIDRELQILESADASFPFMTAYMKPTLKEQHVPSPIMPDYWKGLCTVHGEMLSPVDLDGTRFLDGKMLDGFAHVEMTGYER